MWHIVHTHSYMQHNRHIHMHAGPHALSHTHTRIMFAYNVCIQYKYNTNMIHAIVDDNAVPESKNN
jgi:hypothetical protein